MTDSAQDIKRLLEIKQHLFDEIEESMHLLNQIQVDLSMAKLQLKYPDLTSLYEELRHLEGVANG